MPTQAPALSVGCEKSNPPSVSAAWMPDFLAALSLNQASSIATALPATLNPTCSPGSTV